MTSGRQRPYEVREEGGDGDEAGGVLDKRHGGASGFPRRDDAGGNGDFTQSAAALKDPSWLKT